MNRIVNDNIYCSFCGKSQDEVRKLISGPNGIYICDECVDICSEIIDEDMLEDMLEIALILEESEVQAEKIGLAEDGRYMLTMGNVRVQLGRNIYMSEKISELKGLLPELEGLSGVLHLEEYDATKDSIIFRKDS